MSGAILGAQGAGDDASPACAEHRGQAMARHRQRLRIVEAAEALMLLAADKGGAPLAVICARIGVSQRALHDAFVLVHGVSPARHIRDRRLALVRETLLAAPERPSAVKQAALTLGFRHLAHFSRAYQVRFGERPSETVARARARLKAADAFAAAPGCGSLTEIKP